jgi:uncharacterized protein YfbU (UPF0304 family)
LTFLCFGVGIIGTLAFLLFDPSVGTAVAAIGGILGGLGTIGFNYLFRRDDYARQYVRELHDRLEAHREDVLRKLQKDFRQLREMEGFTVFAEQGGNQFKKVEKKFENLKELLESKMDQGEITYARYSGTAEQVYLSVLDNLSSVSSLLKGVETIDVKYINSRLNSLAALDQPRQEDLDEIETLNARLALRDDQLHQVNQLLSKNEVAMTQIDNTTAAIAQMKTSRGRASTDLDSAMQELEVLAKRADAYSIE